MNRSKEDPKTSRPWAEPGDSRLVLIVAGEASADLHGANLVRAMSSADPSLCFWGIGGREMARAGVRILFSSSEMAVVGITEVFSRARLIYKASRVLKSILKRRKPNLLILIDYPDFNINLARTAKRVGVPVLYYISPQIWAWRSGRVRKIARRVDRMAVILPFEEDFYRKRGVRVEYVGHPLLDAVPEKMEKESVRRELGLEGADPVLGLLPGSRSEEVMNLFPPMAGAARILSGLYPRLKCLLPVASTVSFDRLRDMAQTASLDIRLLRGQAYRVLAASDLALVASGTATLEAGLLGVPMIIVYRVSPLSFRLAKRVVRVSHVGLVNLVADAPFVPELLQGEVTPHNLARAALPLLEHGEARKNMIKELQALRQKLGRGSPSRRTAEIAFEMMG
ncbi:MAG: lipid-A-disaccharide synthase [Deltaproteobacteria bacterium]|nr:lipid-A-disaccharide synthase [Deltaproteobacteria bacterium]